VKELTKVNDTTWTVGAIPGTKVDLVGKDNSAYDGYFAWFRAPSGNYWMYDYNGQRYSVSFEVISFRAGENAYQLPREFSDLLVS
jgi:hypothetical protein